MPPCFIFFFLLRDCMLCHKTFVDEYNSYIRNVREVSIDECKRECIKQPDCAGKSIVHQLAKENVRLMFYIHPYKLYRK